MTISTDTVRADGRRLAGRGGALLLIALEAAAASLVAARVSAQAAPTTPAKSLYTVVELQGLTPSSLTFARKMNASGQVVGRSGYVNGTDTRAVLWTSGIPESLGTLPGGDYSAAFGINRSGEIVGSSNTATALRAFRWTRANGMQDLGTLPGDTGSEAFDINTAGEIVGSSSGPRGIHAVLWGTDGRIEDLGALPGGNFSKAVAINDAGQVVGYSNGPRGRRAFFWTREEGMQDLGVLASHTASEAVALNESGQVVGTSRGSSGTRAFLWTREAGMRPLGVPSGAGGSRALGIDAAGRVVGTASGAGGLRAIVWGAGAGATDLNASVPLMGEGQTLSEVQGVGELGQLIVLTGGGDHGLDTGDHTHDEEHFFRSFILTP